MAEREGNAPAGDAAAGSYQRQDHQVFQLRLADALRPLADPAGILGEACRLLAEQMAADRAYYIEIDEGAGTVRVERDFARDGAISLAGDHPIAEFAWSIALLRGGTDYAVRDTQLSDQVPDADRAGNAALGIISSIGTPLFEAGRLVGALFVAATKPRDWTVPEIALLHDTGERLWTTIQRARADGALREREARLAATLATDLIERLRVSDQLRASEERFRQFGDASSDVLWIRDAKTRRLEYLSPAVETIFGQSVAMAMAEPGQGLGPDAWIDMILPADRAHVQGSIARIWTGERVRYEYRIRRADGELRWLRSTGFPMRGPDGTIERVGGIGQDVTELKRTEAAFQQAQKMQALGQLTGGIAHDFNNMLQGITGSLEMAQQRLATGRATEAPRFLAAAKDAAVRASGLTRRLLAFASRRQMEPQALDVDTLIRGIEEMLRRTLGPAIEIVFRLENGDRFLLCDPSELENAVLNLCINARDALVGGGRLTIATEDVTLTPADIEPTGTAVPGDFVAIAVTDNGRGMPPEVLERALEPFFTTKPQGEGSGLGLSQVYGLVRQLGGVLRLESAPGQGTTVRIFLPAMPADAHGTIAPPVASLLAPPEYGALVLLVEDEVSVRLPLAEGLRDLGYQVAEAEDAAAALRLLDAGLRPGILVTDVGLPQGMDGPSLAEAARARRPGLPVIFITGYTRVALPEGAAVILKPFGFLVLERRIAGMLGAKAGQRPEGEGAG